jgi:hypothetical protein
MKTIMAEQHYHTDQRLELTAAIVCLKDNTPFVLTVRQSGQDSLPSGPFNPLYHRTLEKGLRRWVKEQARLDLGYVEQLYTFGDRGRHASQGDTAPHVMSIGYLALTQAHQLENWVPGNSDHVPPLHIPTPWYRYFPWEDWRKGRPALLDDVIIPHLQAYATFIRQSEGATNLQSFEERCEACFGLKSRKWDRIQVLDRYELLYQCGLVKEYYQDGRKNLLPERQTPYLGHAMVFDHRRILATAMARIRGKLQYSPLIFELMPDRFTLTELQKAVEALTGQTLHKQNFRRQVDSSQLVESTGQMTSGTGGRPAALYRFRQEARGRSRF